VIKVSFFQGETEHGPQAIPLFGPADDVFEKTAAPSLMSEVTRYISTLRPSKDSQYVLLNAMGAGEYWGSNINGDYFPEAALIHAPDDWTGNPLLDKLRAKDWPYGYPTFYYAHPYAHHRNKDATRAFGEVELTVWNPRMKRVELIARVDKDKCDQFGGVPVWDKLQAGQYPDVSMGCKVPYDTCSICLDWDKYRKAQSTFNPRQHASPGQAVLAWHRAHHLRDGKGIRGLSITRADYCEHAKKSMNKILPDGRKVFVYNDYPKFFDISFVFIGADKTAKVMMKIAETNKIWSLPSVELAEKLGYDEDSQTLLGEFVGEEKTASVQSDVLKFAFLGKSAKDKNSEITKDVVPSQFAGKAVPLLTKSEPDIPDDILDALGHAPLDKALSTPTGLGMVLRPREFQRIVLIRLNMRPMADELDRDNIVFPKTDDREKVDMGERSFSPLLARLLLPLLSSRSSLGPIIEKRVVVVAGSPKQERDKTSSLSTDLLHKIGAAYNDYRHGVMELVASTQDLLASAATPSEEELHKLASVPVGELFTPLSFQYLKTAFWDETGTGSNVERGLPSKNTWTSNPSLGGLTS
jgi:hypothetical protein